MPLLHLQDEVDPLDAFMEGNAATAAAVEPAAQDSLDEPQQQQQPDLVDTDMTDAQATAAEPPTAADQQQPDDEDEIDPLDAFMAAEVMPEVAKVRWSEPVKQEVIHQEAAAVDEVAAGAVGAANSSRPGSKGAPGSSKRAASSKGKSKVRRYYGSSDSSDDFTDSEVRNVGISATMNNAYSRSILCDILSCRV